MAEAGWYPDHDDPAQQRYWDGTAWTEHRAPAAAGAAPSSSVEPAAPTAPPAPAPAAGSLRSRTQALTKAARGSAAGKAASQGAQAATSVAKKVTSDAQAREAALRLARTSWSSVLDGANVRDRNGRVKGWRVARAALRPRKTVTRVGRGVAGMGLADVKALATAAAGASTRPEPSDAAIVTEWPIDDLAGARVRWKAAMDVVERLEDGTEVPTEVALDVSYAIGGMLAFCVVGDPPITDEEVVGSIGDLLAILLSVDDPNAWVATDGPPLRVAAAVMRRFGVQPTSLGGNGDLDALLDDPVARLRLAAALSTDGWGSDPVRWFA